MVGFPAGVASSESRVPRRMLTWITQFYAHVRRMGESYKSGTWVSLGSAGTRAAIRLRGRDEDPLSSSPSPLGRLSGVVSRAQPEQHAPPVQRLQVRYAKRGRARFTSHRDFGRAFERALRRAGVPMAYSSGFSPHPRISYANASPTGAASEAEYLEIGLVERRDPDEVRAALDAALPPGLDVVEVVEAEGRALADRLTGSVWRIDVATPDQSWLDRAVAAFLAAESVTVERLTKNGMRAFDTRAAVVSLVRDGSSLRLVTRHLTPLVRPDDVLSALRQLEPAYASTEMPILTRLSQGVLDEQTGAIADPLG